MMHGPTHIKFIQQFKSEQNSLLVLRPGVIVIKRLYVV